MSNTASFVPRGVASSRRKYRNQPVTVDGYKFASKAEARRYGELKLLKLAGQILDLELQPKFVFEHQGVRIGGYKADFRYRLPHSPTLIVEDVKSPASKTQAYELRKKMMKAFHGIEIREVA
jgi:hypothetical protein